MAITGTHMLLYTTQPEALRATFRDVFGWKHVDAGDGWLIFALPPAELGVHPAEGPTFDSGVRHQLTLMCDDIRATSRQLAAKGIEVAGEPKDEGWGRGRRPSTERNIRSIFTSQPSALERI